MEILNKMIRILNLCLKTLFAHKAVANLESLQVLMILQSVNIKEVNLKVSKTKFRDTKVQSKLEMPFTHKKKLMLSIT